MAGLPTFPFVPFQALHLPRVDRTVTHRITTNLVEDGLGRGRGGAKQPQVAGSGVSVFEKVEVLGEGGGGRSRKANKKGCKADVDLGERSDSDADGAKVACNKCGEQTSMRGSQQTGSRSEFPRICNDCVAEDSYVRSMCNPKVLKGETDLTAEQKEKKKYAMALKESIKKMTPEEKEAHYKQRKAARREQKARGERKRKFSEAKGSVEEGSMAAVEKRRKNNYIAFKQFWKDQCILQQRAIPKEEAEGIFEKELQDPKNKLYEENGTWYLWEDGGISVDDVDTDFLKASLKASQDITSERDLEIFRNLQSSMASKFTRDREKGQHHHKDKGQPRISAGQVNADTVGPDEINVGTFVGDPVNSSMQKSIRHHIEEKKEAEQEEEDALLREAQMASVFREAKEKKAKGAQNTKSAAVEAINLKAAIQTTSSSLLQNVATMQSRSVQANTDCLEVLLGQQDDSALRAELAEKVAAFDNLPSKTASKTSRTAGPRLRRTNP